MTHCCFCTFQTRSDAFYWVVALFWRQFSQKSSTLILTKWQSLEPLKRQDCIRLALFVFELMLFCTQQSDCYGSSEFFLTPCRSINRYLDLKTKSQRCVGFKRPAFSLIIVFHASILDRTCLRFSPHRLNFQSQTHSVPLCILLLVGHSHWTHWTWFLSSLCRTTKHLIQTYWDWSKMYCFLTYFFKMNTHHFYWLWTSSASTIFFRVVSLILQKRDKFWCCCLGQHSI